MEKDFRSLYQYKDEKYNQDEIIRRYELEQKVMNTITSGNLDEMHLLNQNLKHLDFNPNVTRIPENNLRDRKNGMVIRNTFCRIAAKTGGLPPIFLHLISEKYAIKIEHATSVHALLDVIAPKMFEEYCSAVQQFSTLSFPDDIREVINYIWNHLTEPIELSEVADVIHVNSAHLSRKFKKVTGFTFTDYINYQRIEYSKLLFYEGNHSITEVASQAGFNSSSYFSKTFKKYTKQSPTSYLNNVLNNITSDEKN